MQSNRRWPGLSGPRIGREYLPRHPTFPTAISGVSFAGLGWEANGFIITVSATGEAEEGMMPHRAIARAITITIIST